MTDPVPGGTAERLGDCLEQVSAWVLVTSLFHNLSVYGVSQTRRSEFQRTRDGGRSLYWVGKVFLREVTVMTWRGPRFR